MSPFDKLKRPVQAATFIKEIDGFRFFAIFTVCMLHLNNFYGRSIGYDYYQGVRDINSWSWFINRCGLGVELFFAISGFVIAMPFFKHYLTGTAKPRYGSYLYRRVTRLEVPFILSCLIIFTMYILTINGNFIEEIGHFLAAITYTHLFFYGKWAPFNPVTWSLEVEIQFYLLAPFIIWFILNKTNKYVRIIKLAVLFALTLSMKYFFIDKLTEWHLHMSILTNLHYFLIGFILAYIFIQRESFLKKKNFLWDIVGIGCFYFLFDSIWESNQLWFCIALLFLFISTFKGAMMNWICTRQAIYVIGGMCYSIYLLHYPLFHFIGKFTKGASISDFFYYNYLIQALIVFPIALIICSFFFVLVEKPCMDKNWPQKLKLRIKMWTKRLPVMKQ